MTKTEMVRAYKERTGMTLKDSKASVEEVFKIIKDTLSIGEDVEITGFGKFYVKEIKEGSTRNPKTGEKLPACKSVGFKYSTGLKNDVKSSLN